MARLLLGLVVVVVVATIYAVIDCAMLAHDRVRGLPKPAWLVIILVLPVVGVVLWFLIGRGRQAQTRTRQLPPDDNPEFFGRSSSTVDPDQDERIRRLEEELAALDSEGPADGPSSRPSATRPGSPAGDPTASSGSAAPSSQAAADTGSGAESTSSAGADASDSGGERRDEQPGPEDGTAKRGKSDDEPGAGRADV